MGFHGGRLELRTVSFALALAALTAACEQCAPGTVGQGVSRLTIRNTGALADLINNDTDCGFASKAQATATTISGEHGMPGSATWVVTDCTIDLSAEPRTSTDCNGVVTTMRGKVTVSATRTIRGLLTGDPGQPVVPTSPDAVTLEIVRATFDNFAVESSDSDAILTQMRGAFSGKVKPQLAASAELGVCSIPTKYAVFEDLAYENATVFVHTEDRDFDVPVPTSLLHAVNGKVGDKENALWGHITVWDSGEPIPTSGDEDGLNPDYDAEQLAASFACTEDLAVPVTFACETDILPQLAQGAARLTVRNFGVVGDRLDKDTRCGFASQGVLESTVRSGEVGGMGSVTFRVDGCTLDFAPGTVAKTSCSGEPTTVGGRVTVSGTKTLRGRLTGDLETPVVPMTDDPAVVELTEITFDNFEVAEKGTALRWISGALRGTVFPRVAADTAQEGACGFETPIARMEDLTYTTASEVRIDSGSAAFTTTIDASSIDALNGTWNGRSNELGGTISLGGETYVLPVDPDDAGLDPEFDQAAFDASWQCGSLEMPPRFECHFVKPIAQGAAQLGAKLLGTVVKLIDADTRCGFSSTRVMDRAAITGNTGDPGGSVVFSIDQPCELSFMAETVAETDCNSKRTLVQGRALVTGTKTINGYVSGDPSEPIVPTVRDPAEVRLSITLDEFSVRDDPGENALLVHGGRLSGAVRPRLAIDTVTGACSIPTPVAQLVDIAWDDAPVRIVSEGRTFEVVANSSALNAQNGNGDGATNQLTGTITIDGEQLSIPAHGGPVLDPAFNQATFDASYACTDNLRIPADDTACNMREVLANGAARLIILSMGSVSRMANADEECAFNARSVLTNPTRVVGDVGDPGLMEWEIDNCRIPGSSQRPAAIDCLGRETWVTGSVRVTGSRTVTGIRDEIRILLIIVFDSIVPNARDSVQLAFDNLVLDNFNVYEREPNETAVSRGLLMRSGTMSARVKPILGERSAEPGTFDVPTPIAHMTAVEVRDADARVSYLGKRFNVRINSASLEAFNGSWASAGMKNMIRGTVTLDGQTFNVSPENLDPDFDQTDFDARYACTEDLRSLVPPMP